MDSSDVKRRWLAAAGVALIVLCGCCTVGAGAIMLVDWAYTAAKVTGRH